MRRSNPAFHSLLLPPVFDRARFPKRIGLVRITVSGETSERLDIYLSEQLSELSRSRIQTLIKSGHILLNGKTVRAKAAVSEGDDITIEIPTDTPREMLPQNIPLEIIHEDADTIVINKPDGLVVHPAAGNPDGTLVNALLHHCKGQLATIGEEERPGIVHRLDKDTSGCIVCAKSDRAHQSLVSQFSERKTSKLYLAVLQGPPPKKHDTVFTHLGRHPVARQKMAVVNPGSGKPAITDYYQLSSLPDGTTLVLCVLHTGRTHQIRVHMKHIGTPLLGDPIYSTIARQIAQPGRLMLHAWRLGFHHPADDTFSIHEAPIPQAYAPWLDSATLSLLTQLKKTSPENIPTLFDS